MSTDQLPDDMQEVALAAASSLEQTLGAETLLTVGVSRHEVDELLDGEPARVLTATISLGADRASIALVVLAPFSEVLERAAPDEILLTSCVPALNSAAQCLGQLLSSTAEVRLPHESDLAGLGEVARDAPGLVYPLLEGSDLVGCLAIHVSEAVARSGATSPAPTTAIDIPAEERRHHLNPLAGVEMGVTAELGRSRMTARELLSISPGVIIDLDRAPGAPVDVVVNGTLIARGEIVVIDDEFAIRISEIMHQAERVR